MRLEVRRSGRSTGRTLGAVPGEQPRRPAGTIETYGNDGDRQKSHGSAQSPGFTGLTVCVRQQASLVEDWFGREMSRTDNRFAFSEKIIRAGVTGGVWTRPPDNWLVTMPLEKLRTFEP